MLSLPQAARAPAAAVAAAAASSRTAEDAAMLAIVKSRSVIVGRQPSGMMTRLIWMLSPISSPLSSTTSWSGMPSTGQFSSMPWRTMLRMPPRRMPGRHFRIGEDDRHGHRDPGIAADPHKVDMQRRVGCRMALHVARQGAVDDTVDRDIDQGREKTAVGQRARQFARLQADQHRLLVVAIDDAGDAPRAPRSPGGSLSGARARLGAEGGDLGHSSAPPRIEAGSRYGLTLANASPDALALLIGGFETQSNRLETDRSSLIRWIASAISGAIVTWRMFCAARTASVATMLSVMTSISIGEAATRGTAPPDSTPWVT